MCGVVVVMYREVFFYVVVCKGCCFYVLLVFKKLCLSVIIFRIDEWYEVDFVFDLYME